jgi:sedoheptulokinase
MILGIDIGTGKVAAVVVDAAGAVVASAARAHHADLPRPAGRAEQDVGKLLAAVGAVVRELPEQLRRQVRAVGVTGQMHGVALVDAAGEPITPLITWQDQRCLEGTFLADLSARAGRQLRTGYGCATLAWLAAHGQLPPRAACGCTIGDLLVARLCGLSRPVTDPTDAMSWGLFDPAALDWDAAAVAAGGIPAELLPKVLPCGATAGRTTAGLAGEWGIAQGIPVAVALGDNQASLLATLDRPAEELALTLGTGGQLSAIVDAVRPLPPASPAEYRPFPGGRVALVAASLAGGSAWAWLAQAARAWLTDLGAPCPADNALYARLNELGLRAEGGPDFRPLFFGERHNPALRGIIADIGPGNFSLGQVARSLARGIVTNLKEMLPPEAWIGRRAVVGSGNALGRNPLLQAMAREVLGLPLRLSPANEEAARGAARLAENL